METTSTDLSRVVGTTEIESLPNIGRNFVDFVKLSSGVAVGRENIGGGAFKEPDTGVGASAAPRLSFGGQSELNTLIQVDGADNVQTFTGLPRATPSQEAAQEFRILNSTYLAEYGRALGGFVNIVTKSGTNDTHGSVYYFGMDDAFAARSPLVQPPDVLSQHQYGGTLGGPIVKDRTFYFLNYEGQRREESNGFSQVIIDNIATLNTVRSRFGPHSRDAGPGAVERLRPVLRQARPPVRREQPLLGALQLPQLRGAALPRRRRPRVTGLHRRPRTTTSATRPSWPTSSPCSPRRPSTRRASSGRGAATTSRPR